MKHDSLQALLAEHFAAAIAQVAGSPPGQIDAAVRPAGDPQFGDYQCNAAMSLARPLKSKPRDVAQRIQAAVEPQLADIVEPLEIAGPGFINIRLRPDFLARYLGEIPPPPTESGAPATGIDVASAPRGRRSPAHSASIPDRVGLAPVDRPQRVVVEYSQPNIAKQMHVGHLRSTVIGDVFARVLAFEGHEVIRQNHIGDWGTQFGRVILGLWHLYVARERRDPEYISRRLAELEAARKVGNEEILRVLDEIRVQHERDLAEDVAAREAGTDKFIRFLDGLTTQPDAPAETEFAYRFVNLVEELAENFPSLIVHNPVRRPPWALCRISRELTAMLQKGGPDNKPETRAWLYACRVTLEQCQELYRHLGVLLTPEDVRGESFYNDRLPLVIEELRKTFGSGGRGAELREDQGALVVYLNDAHGEPHFKNADGQPLGMIVQKSDGAYLYATTDLAAIRFRLKELPFPSGVGAQRLIYVTDARQKLHFEMFFAAARAAGWIADDVRVEHVTFGSVLGPNRKPLKTREGKNVKLRELLEEAEKRAYELLQARDAETEARRQEGEETTAVQLGEEEQHEIARRVGIAAVKYADLCRDRNADYVFNWDTMLALQGNTAPYMMYAYARIRSIYRKAAERFGSPDVYAPAVGVAITHPAERALALRLARLREAVDLVAADLTPHTLCTYLYELAAEFMRFYETCPVLAAPDEAARLSRMRLCDLTARTLKLGLGLLGIEVIERM